VPSTTPHSKSGGFEGQAIVYVAEAALCKKKNKKWVKNFIEKSSGTRVTKALEFLKELQDMKHNTH
jgi:hypothetical protein